VHTGEKTAKKDTREREKAKEVQNVTKSPLNEVKFTGGEKQVLKKICGLKEMRDQQKVGLLKEKTDDAKFS